MTRVRRLYGRNGCSLPPSLPPPSETINEEFPPPSPLPPIRGPAHRGENPPLLLFPSFHPPSPPPHKGRRPARMVLHYGFPSPLSLKVSRDFRFPSPPLLFLSQENRPYFAISDGGLPGLSLSSSSSSFFPGNLTSGRGRRRRARSARRSLPFFSLFLRRRRVRHGIPSPPFLFPLPVLYEDSGEPRAGEDIRPLFFFPPPLPHREVVFLPPIESTTAWIPLPPPPAITIQHFFFSLPLLPRRVGEFGRRRVIHLGLEVQVLFFPSFLLLRRAAEISLSPPPPPRV